MFFDIEQIYQLPGFWNICCCQFYEPVYIVPMYLCLVIDVVNLSACLWFSRCVNLLRVIKYGIQTTSTITGFIIAL